MPVKEKITFFELENVFTHNFTGDGLQYGQEVDTADYDKGIFFGMFVRDDDGTTSKYTMSLVHGDESDLSDAVAIPKENLVFGRETGILPWQLGNNTPGTASAKMSTEGIIGTKRYVRADITSSDFDSTPGTPAVYVVCIKNPEVVPTKQRLGSV